MAAAALVLARLAVVFPVKLVKVVRHPARVAHPASLRPAEGSAMVSISGHRLAAGGHKGPDDGKCGWVKKKSFPHWLTDGLGRGSAAASSCA